MRPFAQSNGHVPPQLIGDAFPSLAGGDRCRRGRVVVLAKDGHAIALAHRRLARHLDQLCGEDGDGGQLEGSYSLPRGGAGLGDLSIGGCDGRR